MPGNEREGRITYHMPNKLKDLKITSTDLVTQGANPDAHIRLFKRKEASVEPGDTLLEKAIAALRGVFGKSAETVRKEARTFDDEMDRERKRDVSSQMWSFCYTLSDSLSSIIFDDEMKEDGKRGMMYTSLDEFAETLRNAIPLWAAGNKAQTADTVAKSAAQQAALDELLTKHTQAVPDTTAANDNPEGNADGGGSDDGSVAKNKDVREGAQKSITNQQEETDTMKIDKSKMTPEEQATLAEFEKKYGQAEPEGTPATTPGDGDVAKGAETTPALHPEVRKALDEAAELRKKQDAEIEALKKSLEIKDLSVLAQKYEIIGKKADELAPKLYDLKKAGGTAYDDYVGLLDEQLNLVEKGGMFSEIGSSRSGASSVMGGIGAKVDEIRKSNPGMTMPEAIAKAYEENPELAAQYEAEYNTKGRV